MAATVPADPRAAAKRVADRAARVSAGLEELDQWLCDQIRAGLAALSGAGLSGTGLRGGGGVDQRIEAIAARMVDAQAPGIAGRLRRVPAIVGSGEGWPGRVLEQYAQLRLLIRAHRRLADLPAPLAAAVRGQVGYPVAAAEVLTGPPVRDTWAVLGLRDQREDGLSSRRIWLQGNQTQRTALILSFVYGVGYGGRSLDDSLTPGTSVDADLHFYPDGRRALVGTRHAEAGPLGRPAAVSIGQALTRYAAALAADPWTAGWPMLLAAVAPVQQAGRWLLREDGGDALPIVASAGAPWRLVACCGGSPCPVAGEWSAEGFVPLSVIHGQALVRL